MNFDTWFHGQSKLVQIIILVLPFIGWIADALVRWSVFLKNTNLNETNNVINLVMALVVTIFGISWILTIIDAIMIAMNNKLFLEQ